MKSGPEGDLLHLLHMKEGAELARNFVANREREDLDHDRMFELALVKAVELIGESANRLSDEFCERHNQIPWRKIIGMRHVLAHNYWQIEPDIVWDGTQCMWRFRAFKWS